MDKTSAFTYFVIGQLYISLGMQ